MLGLLFFAFGCDKSAQAITSGPPVPVPPVKITDTVEGEGPAAAEADLLMIEYVGMLADSEAEFDSNADRDPETGDGTKPPYPVTIGKSEVIDGWHEGLVGMKVGGERTIEIPWQKGYGEAGSPPNIGPKANLVFKIKLLDMVKSSDTLIYDDDMRDIVVGTGPEVKDGDKITIHYRGTLVNGLRFDSSYERGDVDAGGTPLTFKIGRDRVIRGLDAGILGMRAGGKRFIRTPPMLAYGFAGYSAIPGDQVLLFVIELLSIE